MLHHQYYALLLLSLSVVLLPRWEGLSEARVDSDVVDATDANFYTVVNSASLVLVEFYAPWCGHSKKLAPEWEKAATMITNDPALQGTTLLAKLDATTEQVALDVGVTEVYPTIKVYRDGELQQMPSSSSSSSSSSSAATGGEYDGPFEGLAIVDWVRSQVGPAVSFLSGDAEFDALRKEFPIVTVLYQDPAALTPGSKDMTHKDADAERKALEVKSFTSVAHKLRSQSRFAIVPRLPSSASSSSPSSSPSSPESDDTSKEEKEEKLGQVVVYKPFDNKRDVYSGDITDTKVLTKFVDVAILPLLAEIGPRNYRSYRSRRMPMGWLFLSSTNSSSDSARSSSANNKLKAEVHTVAATFVGQVIFVVVNANLFAGMASQLGLSGATFPSFALEDEHRNHYAYDELRPITASALTRFTADLLEHRLQKTIRSEHAPASPVNEDGLTTIVGSTFDALLTNEKERDVLIQFYAPWCGHCKQLAPAYSAVAKAVKESGLSSVLRVARLDATANDFDKQRYTVTGYPTIYWVPRNRAKTPVEYEGNHTAQGIVSFLRKKAPELHPLHLVEDYSDEL